MTASPPAPHEPGEISAPQEGGLLRRPTSTHMLTCVGVHHPGWSNFDKGPKLAGQEEP